MLVHKINVTEAVAQLHYGHGRSLGYDRYAEQKNVFGGYLARLCANDIARVSADESLASVVLLEKLSVGRESEGPKCGRRTLRKVQTFFATRVARRFTERSPLSLSGRICLSHCG